MYRRAYALLIGVATTMGVLAIVTSIALDKKLADPQCCRSYENACASTGRANASP